MEAGKIKWGRGGGIIKHKSMLVSKLVRASVCYKINPNSRVKNCEMLIFLEGTCISYIPIILHRFYGGIFVSIKGFKARLTDWVRA